MDALILIAIVMLVAGILGGIINFYMVDKKTESPLPWWQHAIIGIGAAFMVPLFLNMISSSLIDTIRGTNGTPGDLSKIFVLSGFCLVASISSRAFIRTISQKVLQEIQDTKRVAEEAKAEAGEAKVEAGEAKAVVAPFVEEEASEESSGIVDSEEQARDVPLSDDEKQILKMMISSRFSMRSISGLAKDTNLDNAKVNAAISSLLDKSLIVQGQSTAGQPRWYPSVAGRLHAMKFI